ncbi:protease-associated domain-containing protein 1-like isoform X1 [Dermacentor silvarum]|uniref:protease-associated domain-containing protein 1-like isoform X1 n=1 Tax=Dermacentor silvarum TaxID=543639 RepID=UPI002100C6FC|nr:protease-associated domain-containing protein 1-like isoform X1 [Dermacentor silvarum]
MPKRLLRGTASLLLTYCCFLVDVALLANLVSSDGKFLKEDIFFEILEPESLRYTFRLRPAHEFGSSFATQLSNVGLVLSEPLQGCASLVNRLELRHNVVLVERGFPLDLHISTKAVAVYHHWRGSQTSQLDCCSLQFRKSCIPQDMGCSFLTKCVEVRRQGALAVIVADSDPSNDDQYVDMMDDSTRRNCSIPAAFLLGKDGFMIRRGLQAHGLRRALINIPVNVSGVPAHRLRQPPWLVW